MTRFSAVFVFCFFCFFQAVPVLGQPVFLDVQEATSLYPDESFIVLHNETHYKITVQDDTLHVTRNRKEQFLYLKNLAAFNTERSLSSSSFVELTDHNANTYLPNGKKFKRLAVKDYAINNAADGSIFFDDQKDYIFTFPGLSQGAIIELESNHLIKEARFFPSIIFQSSVPTFRFSCTIECDPSINLSIKNFNLDGLPISFEKKEEKNAHFYKWTGENIPGIKDEKSQAAIRYYIGHTVPIIESFQLKDGTKQSYLSSTADLYKWYSTFIDSINNQTVIDNLKPVADSITNGLETDFEKAREIFYWVQKNIKYIAFEAGMGGLIPRNADQIYNQRYGDCKDKTSLIHALMTNAGLDAYFCWIGSDEIPYTYDEVYSPLVDNHMIAAVKLDGKFHFLDGTGTFNNFYSPTAFIQGKEVLVGIDKENFIVETVPLIPAEKNLFDDSVHFSLDEKGVLHGEGRLKVTGYPKLYLQYDLVGENEKRQEQVIDSYTEIGSNKCILKDYTLPVIDNFDTVLIIPHKIEIDNLVKKLGSEMYLNLNMYQSWSDFDLEKDRSTAMSFKFCSSYRHRFYLKIPEGYTVTHIPEAESFSNEKFHYTTTYSFSDNVITYDHYIHVDTDLIKPDQFDNWRAFISSLKKSYRKSIVLKTE